MADTYSNEYWSTQFDITRDDLKRITERMEREGAPQDLKAMALRIVKGRLEHGHDISPAALGKLTGKDSVRLWDPATAWQSGDEVLVAKHSGNDRDGTPLHRAYLGEVVKIKDSMASIRLEGSLNVKYQLAAPGSTNALKWRETVRGAVEKKLHSGDPDQQAEGLLLQHGERILNRLAETLQADSNFIGLEGKWYLTQKLPRPTGNTVKTVHRALLQKPSASLDEILPLVEADTPTDLTIWRMTIQTVLQQAPDHFENLGTPARPQWRARLPEPERAEVAYYAYDPQTWEILCRPGQRLTKKQAQRLQELDLYAHVVTFAE